MNPQQMHDRLLLLEEAVFGKGKRVAATSASNETPLQKAIREAKEKSK